MKVGRRWRGARVREVTDAAEREKPESYTSRPWSPYDYFDVPLVEWTVPTPGKIVHKHEKWFDGGVPVAIELAPQA